MNAQRQKAIEQQGSLRATLVRSRRCAMRYARMADTRDERAEWINVARSYHDQLMRALRTKREATESCEQ